MDIIKENEVLDIMERIMLTCQAHERCYDDKCPFRNGNADDKYENSCIFEGITPCQIDTYSAIKRRV